MTADLSASIKMSDEASLASSYYEVIDNLSVIWEETSQDLHSIVTNPKHYRRLSSGPIPYPPSSPRLSPRSLDGKSRVSIPHPPSSPLLSPRSLDGTPRVRNSRKSPLLRNNVLSLGPASIAEADEREERNNDTENPGRPSIFVTSLRTGELVALPLQDDEFTFESCTTGSDMQTVESIEEYFSDEEDQDKLPSRRNRKEESTEDEMIFEIVDELKEELMVIKHARDEAMKALYLHDSPLAKTQRKAASKSEKFLSRLSTIPQVPTFGNTGEITDSSSLPDVLPRVKKAVWKDKSATFENPRETNDPLPAGVSATCDSSLPETDAKDDSLTTRSAEPASFNTSLPDPPFTMQESTQQGDTTQISQFVTNGSVKQVNESSAPTQSSTATSEPPSSNIDENKGPSETSALSSLEETSTREAIEAESFDLNYTNSIDTTLLEDFWYAPFDAPSTLDSTTTQPTATANVSTAETTDESENNSPTDVSLTVDPAVSAPDRPIDALKTNAQEETELPSREEKSSKVNQITPAPHFALMQKWFLSNLKPSYFDQVQRQAFRINIDGLGGQRRRVQYNTSRLLLKRRLRKHFKPQGRNVVAQKRYEKPHELQSERSNDSDNESIEIFFANPQEDDCDSVQGRRRPLRRSSRRKSEGDLRNMVREGKRAELRSKIHGIEDRLERIRMNLSSSFSSLISIENDEGEEDSDSDADVAVEDNQGLTKGWSSSRSFSEGMLSPEPSPRERKGSKGRLERIRGKKKMNLEKLQHALDSAMEAVSAEIDS
ncbi:unnamed protein product [Cylindrotheca closterium]|uniref:Uncharacterized protein n=1 Tax=Cylindrotheca closterium TaxID=2856 RepID=A0AAD2JGU9_9STRA|nr:unnamed protein product [Cylindrotheca closterium]